MRDLMPRRPTFFRSAWPAMPTTRTPKSSGAMITLMRRRKIVPRSCKLTAIEGASWPNSAPARRPTKIQVVSERRDVAYAATRRIASQRRSGGTSASEERCGNSDGGGDGCRGEEIFFHRRLVKFSIAAERYDG